MRDAGKSLVVARLVWLDMMRSKDAYVLAILMGALLWVLVSMDFFGLGGMSRYVADVGLLLAWVFGWLLAAAASARLLPREEQRRTIYPLLAKPLTRGTLVAGKWLGAWVPACVAVGIFYLLVAAMVALRGGTLSPAVWLQGLALHAVALAVLCALGLLCSTRLAGDAAVTLTLVLSGAAFFVLPRAPEMLLHERGWRAAFWMMLYHLAPRFELFDLRQRMVHGYDPAPGMVVLGVLCYGALYSAILLLLAWLAYRCKRFTRTSAL